MYGPVLIEIEKSRIYITSEMTDRDRCKQIPGSRWDKDTRKWHAPLSWAACKQLRTTFTDRLIIGKELMQWATEEVTGRIQPSLALREALSISDPGGLPSGLYDFQQAGALFLITAASALLADPMGSGKTIQVLAAAQAINAAPVLVVCPNSMKRTWAREFNKWWPKIPVFIVEGTALQRKKILAEAADTEKAAIIINWESVRLHSRLAPYGSIALSDKEKVVKELNQIPFKLIVADEAHRMKDPKSKQTRAVWAVSQNPMVTHRWALTGTPLTNKPDTLWPILHFISPKEWPSKTKFIERYCLSILNVWGALEIFGLNPNTQDEFYEIFDPRFRRMQKEIILPQLPPIVEETRYVEMGAKQKKAYLDMVENLFAADESGQLVIAQNPISQLTRLTQYASAYLTIDETGKPWLSDPSCKLDQLMEDLEDINEPVVVFAQSRQLINMASARLEKAGIQHSIIEGGQSPDVRQNAIDAFQNGSVDILLAVLQAGGTGLTLNRARIGIWLQRPWSNVDYQQSIGRIHRIGSENHGNVVVLNYITIGTIEVGQMSVLEGKAQSLEEVVRDRDALRRFMDGTQG